MQAFIQNFRSISQADIRISPIALVIGPNGSGKSSIARAVGAALTGMAIPYAGLKKNTASRMVKDGQQAASIALHRGDDAAFVTWPAAEVTGKGGAIIGSPTAAGLNHFTDMDAKERSALLNQLLKTEPSLDDLKEAVAKVGLHEKQAENAWKDIEAMGWAAAHAKRKEEATKAKGAWEQITKERYGSDKAKTWMPAGIEIADSDPDLQHVLSGAKEKYEAAIKQQAVSAADIDKLRDQAGRLKELEKQDSDAHGIVQMRYKALQEAEAELKALPTQSDPDKTLICPHCAGEVQLSATSGSSYTLLKSEPISEDLLKKNRLALAAASGKFEKAKADLQSAQQEYAIAMSTHAQAKAAAEKLAGAGEPSAAVDTAPLQEAVKLAEQRLADYGRYREAGDMGRTIACTLQIVDILAEDGLRMTKLSTALANFNEMQLQPLCMAFGIAPVTVEATMQVCLGGRPYPLLSASEQFRVRTVLQLAIAQLDGSAAVIIDEADILDKRGRSGLLGMIAKSGLAALICMTMNDPAQAPNLAKMNCGNTYWLENGIANPVGQQAARAA